MKKLISFFVFFAITALALQVKAVDVPIVPSTVENPVVYNIHCAAQNQTYYWDSNSSPSTTDKAQFIFIASGTPNAFYIYCLDTESYIGYQKAASYNDGANFAVSGVLPSDPEYNFWYFEYESANTRYVLAPYNTTGVAGRKLNWYGGVTYYGSQTVGLYNNSSDNGSKWGFEMVGDPTSLHIATNSTIGPDILTNLVDGQRTLTTNGYSGQSGLTVSSTGASFKMYTHNGVSCLGIKPSKSNVTNTIVITAPSGYVITRYELGGYQYTSSESYSLTAEQGTGTTSANINSTTQSGITPSLNVDVASLFSSSVSFRMSNTNSTNNQYMLVPWFKVYLKRVENPGSVEDGDVYTLSCVYSDGAYPLYNNEGTPNVSTSTSTTPQMFVFRESATTLDGATLYNLQRAEGDGNYLVFATASGKTHSFSTTPGTGNYCDFLFLNNNTSLPTGTTRSGSNPSYANPYTGFYGYYLDGTTKRFPAFRGGYNNSLPITGLDAGASINDKIYAGTTYNTRAGATERYVYRWIIEKQPYTVYDLVVQNAGGTAVPGVKIRYTNAADAGITLADQQNGGFFVIKNGVEPTPAMFSCQCANYTISNISITGTTITVEVAVKYTDGIYTISNIYDHRGTIVYQESADANSPVLADVTLSGYESNDVDLSAVVGDGKYWYVRTTNDGTYFYNLEKKMFLNSRTEAVVRFSPTPVALTLIPAANPDYWNIKSGDNFLNTSPGYAPGGGDVRWYSSDPSGDHLTLNAEDISRPTEVALADIMIDGTAVTTITEGRYVFKNRGTGKYLVQSGDVIGACNRLGPFGDTWDVVESPTSGQYFIRNAAD